jgi:hypothetical protein
MAAEEPRPANVKPEGRQLFFGEWGFQVKVPEKNWKVTENHDERNPVELVHTRGALIQVMTFSTTMTGLDELQESLNKTYENNFTRDGAKNYKCLGKKPYKTANFAGRRARYTFVAGKELYTLDQIYLEGKDRIYVIVLTAKKEVYAQALKDFETLAASCEPAAPPQEGGQGTQEKNNVQDPGKGNGR